MGRIVAIAGGSLTSNKAINEYTIKMINTTTKNVLFIGTASGDADSYIENFSQSFSQMGCDIKYLCLITKTYADGEIDELLSWADIIYVGGGDTISMMKVWKKYGLDKKLKNVYTNDSAILTGISAGAICWFCCGHSNSGSLMPDGGKKYGWANEMLDIHHLAYCPHYDDEGRDSFDEMLKEKNMAGLAMDADTAFVEQNGRIYYIKSNVSAKAYMLKYINGQLEKEELKLEAVN